MDKSVTYVDQNNNELQFFPKANELIASKYESTLIEDKILTAALKNIKKDGKRIYAELYANELKEAFGTSGGSFYTLLRKSTVNVGSRFFLAEDREKEEFQFMNLVTDATYKDGKYTIDFNHKAEKYLFDIKKNYTLLNAKIIYKMKSRIALKLYENLESKCYVGKRKQEKYQIDDKKYIINYNLNELKFLLGAVDLHNASIAFLFATSSKENDWDEKMRRIQEIADKVKDESTKKDITPKWAVWKDFRKVLSKAVEEVNEVSNMNVSFEPIKQSKNVTGVKFEITYKDLEELKEITKDSEDLEGIEEPTSEMLFEMMDEVHKITGGEFSLKDINTLIQESKYNVELIKKQYMNYLISKSRNNISEEGKMGWMISAIRQDYNVSVDKESFKKTASDDLDELINSVISDE